MKRYIRSAFESNVEKVSEIIPELRSIVEDCFVEQGFGRNEARDYYTFEMNPDGTDVVLELRAELSLGTFFEMSSDLNEVAESVVKGAYFDAVEPGIYECVFEFDGKDSSEDEDPILSEKNIRPTIETIAREVSKSMEIDFEVEEFLCRKADVDTIRVYVELQSQDYESVAFVDFDVEDIVSLVQVKSELADELYSKLVNNIVAKY